MPNRLKTLSFLPFVLLLLCGCGGAGKMKSITVDSNWKQCTSIDTIGNVIFSDNFNDNLNGWPLTDNESFLVNLNNGVLHIKKYDTNKNKNGCLWLVKAIRGLDTKKDFQISYDARFLKADDIYNSIDIQWGNIRNDLYQLFFTIDGRITLKRFTDNKSPKWLPIASNVMKGLINKDHSNRIVIRQVGDTCIICINGIEVIRQQVERIDGNDIGIQQCLRVEWEMDNIEIRQ